MLLLKRLLLLALLSLVVVFAFQNQGYLGQSSEIVFIKYRHTMIQGFWLMLAFLAGALLFLAMDLPRNFGLRRELRRKSEELARAQFELTRLQQSVPPPAIPPADMQKRLEL